MLLLVLSLLGGTPPTKKPAVAPPIPKTITTVSGVTDEAELTVAAREFHVPPIILWAIARKESGHYKGNRMRGPGFVVVVRDSLGDSVGTKRVCREIGRMQILPCMMTAIGHIKLISWTWLSVHCTPKNLLFYRHNIRCGAAILAYRHRRLGNWSSVMRRYNGSGPMARDYQNTATAIIGQITLRMADQAKADSIRVMDTLHVLNAPLPH